MAVTTDTDWLALIRAEPDNPTPRLAYADWLDEAGDPDGELVRLLCEVQRPTPCETCNGRGKVRFDGVPGKVYKCLACIGSGVKSKLCPDCHGLSLIDGDCDRCGHTGVLPDSAYQPGPAYTRLEAVTGGLDAVIERLSERDRRLFLQDCLGGQTTTYLADYDTTTVLGWIADAAAQEGDDPAAERRWQLCRAVEYRLDFAPLVHETA